MLASAAVLSATKIDKSTLALHLRPPHLRLTKHHRLCIVITDRTQNPQFQLCQLIQPRSRLCSVQKRNVQIRKNLILLQYTRRLSQV